jgi:hypothetical protein
MVMVSFIVFILGGCAGLKFAEPMPDSFPTCGIDNIIVGHEFACFFKDPKRQRT